MIPIGGGTSTLFAADSTGPSAIAIDATNVYWTDFDGPGSNGTVMKAPLGGGSATQIASAQATPNAIAIDCAGVYWTNLNFYGGASAGIGTVMRFAPK
jgi:hypothetical protein